MKLWSKGLGKLILPFDIGKADSIRISGESILIEGKIIEKKVNWPYKINLFLEDMLTFTRFMAYSNTILYFLKTQLGTKFILFVLVRILKAFFLLPIALFERIAELFTKVQEKQTESSFQNREKEV